MQQFSSNVQWVYDNTPRALYTNWLGMQKPTGIKIVGGMTFFGASTSDRTTTYVSFGNAFSMGCYPVVTLGMNNTFQNKVFCRTWGSPYTQPDHIGMNIAIEVAATNDGRDKIESNFLVHWMALGY